MSIITQNLCKFMWANFIQDAETWNSVTEIQWLNFKNENLFIHENTNKMLP